MLIFEFFEKADAANMYRSSERRNQLAAKFLKCGVVYRKTEAISICLLSRKKFRRSIKSFEKKTVFKQIFLIMRSLKADREMKVFSLMFHPDTVEEEKFHDISTFLQFHFEDPKPLADMRGTHLSFAYALLLFVWKSHLSADSCFQTVAA